MCWRQWCSSSRSELAPKPQKSLFKDYSSCYKSRELDHMIQLPRTMRSVIRSFFAGCSWLFTLETNCLEGRPVHCADGTRYQQREKRVGLWVAKTLSCCVQVRSEWSTEEDTHRRPGHHWMCEFGDSGNDTSCEKKFNISHRKWESGEGCVKKKIEGGGLRHPRMVRLETLFRAFLDSPDRGISLTLRCENRPANRPANRETGLEMSCCPDNDLMWVQITQSYPNRLRFSSLPCPQSPCHALIFPVF
jgi:hypothetical protein